METFIAGAEGGGIYSQENLTLLATTVSDNASSDLGAGIYSALGTLSVNSSVISGNVTPGAGGGIHAVNDLIVLDTDISGNSAGFGGGGGILTEANATIANSTIRGNKANNSDLIIFSYPLSSSGGGIKNFGSLTVTNSMISGNYASSTGGGVYSYSSSSLGPKGVSITNSTVDGNSAPAGGGLSIGDGVLALTQTTISGNSSDSGAGLDLFRVSATVRHSTIAYNFANRYGGGVSILGGSLVLDHTIVAANVGSFGRDIARLFGAALSSTYGLIGNNADNGLAEAAVGSPDTNGNLIGGPLHGNIDPQLSQLGYHGGPTKTLALNAGSPAIDAGDPLAVAGSGFVPATDQRGAPFSRVYDGDGMGGSRVDIGAFERQPLSPAVLGDFNQNNTVDAADYVLWRKTLGTSITAFSGADGDGDGVVDQDDYDVWRGNFGATVPAGGGGNAALAITEPAVELDEAVAPLPAAPIAAKEAATSRPEFALFESRATRHNTTTPLHERSNVFRASKSANERLLLALAIDRFERTPRQAVSVFDDRYSDDHPASDSEFECLTENPLDLALAEW